MFDITEKTRVKERGNEIMEREHSDDEEDEEKSMNMLREKTREKKRKREGRSEKEHYSNISVLELEQLRYLVDRKEEKRHKKPMDIPRVTHYN